MFSHRSTGVPRPLVSVLLISSLLVLAVAAPAAAMRETGAMAPTRPVPTAAPAGAAESDGGAADHLVVSEVVTGGASAVDELIELYNPSLAPLPLEGLELIYVSASGATISRRAAWEAGSPTVPSGGHLLVANADGVYAAIADSTFSSGMASTGGSVALRISGATTPIDAVGWGTAAAWIEGAPAAAPPAASSLERLPGGELGSTQDTGDNARDFVVRAEPDPQNSGSPLVPPGVAPTEPPAPTDLPTPSLTPDAPTPTSSPSRAPTTSPSPAPTSTALPSATATPSGPPPIPVAEARTLPDGEEALVEGVAVTASDFADGGGFVVDGSGGIAVLVSDGGFERGQHLLVSGMLDDRYRQRTLRVAATDVTVLGTGVEPAPRSVATGEVGEGVEGSLVRVGGVIVSRPDTLSSGLALDVDDGSGPARVVLHAATAISVEAWTVGMCVELVGVVGQRDASGAGAGGYRVQPRDARDVLVLAPSSPAPSASPGVTATPRPSATPASRASPAPSLSPEEPLVTIAAARGASPNTRLRVRGVVTSPSGLIDPGTVVVQDASAGIVLRTADEVGTLSRGQLVEVRGTRSTRSGMLTIRVTQPATHLGSQPEPVAVRLATGSAGESREAQLVTVRGALTGAPRRSSAGSVSFAVDDGSGELRVFSTARSGIPTDGLAAGAWIEVTGVLGQETSGSQPDRGYRLLPRDAADLRLLAPALPGGSAPAPARAAGVATGTGPTFTIGEQDLSRVGSASGEPAGATLVHAMWPELGLAGLLWDGAALVAIGLSPESLAAVERAADGRRLPIAVGVVGTPTDAALEDPPVPLLAIGTRGALVPAEGRPAPPQTAFPEGAAAWVSAGGRLARVDGSLVLDPTGQRIAVDRRCADGGAQLPGGGPATVRVTGIGVGGPTPRIVVACDGIRLAPQLAAPAGKDTERRASEPLPSSHAEIVAGTSLADATSGIPPFALALAVALAALAAALGIAWRQGALGRWATAFGIGHGASAEPSPQPVERRGDDEGDEHHGDDGDDEGDEHDEDQGAASGRSSADGEASPLPPVPRLSVIGVRNRGD